MKKIAYALIAAAALTLSGCASMWKTMGVATEKSVAARDEQNAARMDELKNSTAAQADELKKSVDDLAAKVAASKDVAAEVALIRKQLDELQGTVDQLPQDTLKKLAEVLNKAAADLEAAAPKK